MNGDRLVRGTCVGLVVGIALLCVGCRGLLGRRLGPGAASAYQVDAARLTSANPVERAGEQVNIVKAGPAAVASLKALAGAGEDRTRRAAVQMLGELAEANAEARADCIEALIEIYLGGDASVAPTAAMALVSVGRPAVERLAAALADMPAGAVEGPPPWRRVLTLMLQAGEDLAVDALVALLQDESAAPKVPPPAKNFTLVRALQSATQQSFGYDPNAEPQERQAAIERWRSWWKVKRAQGKD